MDSAKARDQGERLLRALYTQNLWVIRTVEQVTFVDNSTVRRRVIRHFKVPPHKEARATVNERKCLLPIFTLPKTRFISCDLRNSEDQKVALRPIDERWELTFQAVFSLLLSVDSAVDNDEKLKGLLMNMIRTIHPETAINEFIDYQAELEDEAAPVASLLATKEFWELGLYIARNYLVFADVEADEHRNQMISYVLDQRFGDEPSFRDEVGMEESQGADQESRLERLGKQLGLIPHKYYHPWAITGAGSNHLEIRAPVGVYFGAREVVLPGHADPLRHAGTSTSYVRFLAPRSVPQGEGSAEVSVHPGSGVMRTAGPIVGALFTFILAIVTLTNNVPTFAATLLLFLPGFTSIVAAKTNEHPYVTRVVRGVRYLTLFPILIASLAVLILVVDWPSCLLYILVILSLAATAVLLVGSRRLRVQPAFKELVLDDLTRVA